MGGRKKLGGGQMFEIECRGGSKVSKWKLWGGGVRSFEIEVLGGQKIKT